MISVVYYRREWVSELRQIYEMEAWASIEKILIVCFVFFFLIWKYPLTYCFQFWACIIFIPVLYEFLSYGRNSIGDEDMSEN